MEDDRLESTARKVSGSLKEAIGKITGDTKLQAEGKTDKAEAAATCAAGTTTDTVRGAVESDK